MILNEEEKRSRLCAVADKKDLTLIDYEELYNKRAELEAEELKEKYRFDEIKNREMIQDILNKICYFMTKRETIMKYYLPDNVLAWQIIDIFERHGYSVKGTVEHDKKTLVFYLDEPKKRLRSMEQEK